MKRSRRKSYKKKYEELVSGKATEPTIRDVHNLLLYTTVVKPAMESFARRYRRKER